MRVRPSSSRTRGAQLLQTNVPRLWKRRTNCGQTGRLDPELIRQYSEAVEGLWGQSPAYRFDASANGGRLASSANPLISTGFHTRGWTMHAEERPSVVDAASGAGRLLTCVDALG